VEIETIRHKALRTFVETGKARGLMEEARIRKMIAYIAAVEEVEELRTPPNYGAHELTGGRAGTWALTVTRNWRMTFGLDDEGRIVDLDLEDYH
jgi:toxin HigB-1